MKAWLPGRVIITKEAGKPGYIDAKLAQLGKFVARFVADYGLESFVETGAGFGQSTVYAQTYPFKTIWASEIDRPTIDQGLSMFPDLLADRRITIFIGKSVSMLERLERLPLGPALFWLDAHFPGTHFGAGTWASEPDDMVRMPLEQELRTILTLRPAARDVIMIDDLWLWSDDEFDWGRTPADIAPFCPKHRGIEFIERVVSGTHSIEVHKECGGWLGIVPKA